MIYFAIKTEIELVVLLGCKVLYNTTVGINKKNNLLLNYQLCFALYSASNSVMRAYNKRLKKYNLTYTQYLVLLVLWETPGTTLSYLSEKLKLGSGSLSPVLKRMQNNGLLLKVRSAEDERTINLNLTQKGNELKETVSKIQEDVSCQTGLTHQDYCDLRDSINELNKVLELTDSPRLNIRLS